MSWGRQAQSQLELLFEAENVASETHEHYQPAATPSLLGQLQDSLLDLQHLEPGSLQWSEGDRSLEVHACHSLTRELEVLHDHLLGLFKADPQLRAGDVLVVTPDLEAAAPLIDAVFGSVPAARRIPFEVTGLGRARANPPVRAFLDVLALAASRCTVTELHGLLQQPVVARRFGLDEAALQQVHEWLLEAGVHWGLDDDHLRGESLPVARHTLAAGLERLFLGYAMPDGAAGVFADVLPSGRAEGSAALPLGALQSFADELRLLRRQLAQAHPPGALAQAAARGDRAVHRCARARAGGRGRAPWRHRRPAARRWKSRGWPMPCLRRCSCRRCRPRWKTLRAAACPPGASPSPA